MASEGPASQPSTKSERVPGTTILPVSRVKRVIKEDKEVSLVNAEATFCITYATELFMEYLVQEGLSRARGEKRKTIYYKDLASAVGEVEQFEFLEDVIPQTMTLKSALERRKDTVQGADVDMDENSMDQPGSGKKHKSDASQADAEDSPASHDDNMPSNNDPDQPLED
ncbi:histone-fold-containing protein [Dichotomocladium elegans]|nr:histone-fold-containing protein [Dichotomocladium elegans]